MIDIPQENCISFHSTNKNWLIKIDMINGTILFNTEDFPNLLPTDFAKEFAACLWASNFLKVPQERSIE